MINSYLQEITKKDTHLHFADSSAFTVLDRMLAFHTSMLSKLDTCRASPELCLPELFLQSAKELEENLSEIYGLQKEEEDKNTENSELFEKITSEIITRIQNYLLVLTEMRTVYTENYDELTYVIDSLAMIDFESRDLSASPASSLENIYTSLPQFTAETSEDYNEFFGEDDNCANCVSDDETIEPDNRPEVVNTNFVENYDILTSENAVIISEKEDDEKLFEDVNCDDEFTELEAIVKSSQNVDEIHVENITSDELELAGYETEKTVISLKNESSEWIEPQSNISLESLSSQYRPVIALLSPLKNKLARAGQTVNFMCTIELGLLSINTGGSR